MTSVKNSMSEILEGIGLNLNSTRPLLKQKYFFDYYLGDIISSINLQNSVKIYDDVQGSKYRNEKAYLNMILPGMSVGVSLA